LLIVAVLLTGGHFREVLGQHVLQPERRPLPSLGRSYEDIQAVVTRYQTELKQIPGVSSVVAGDNQVIVNVLVHTDERGEKPTTLPSALQAVPKMLEGLPVEIWPMYILPPPPGVIVVQPFPPDPQTEACPPESVQTWNLDHLECFAITETCPDGFQETMSYDWRFCMNPSISSTILHPMSLPIAGIPFAQVQAILARHQAELGQVPGLTGVGLGAEGIEVETDHPEAVPSTIEGVPVIVKPPVYQIGADLMGYGFPQPSGSGQ
jgi:hypothetical protein